MKQKILITGANGFLASSLVKLFNATEAEVYGLVRAASSSNNAISFKKVYQGLDELLNEQTHFDIVFHLAAYIPIQKDLQRDFELVQSNISLTASLALQYKHARFILASSVSVYGTPVELPLKINSAFNSPGLYGLSKLAAETIIRNLENFAVIRFSSIIGPGMPAVSFIPKVISKAKKDAAFSILGDGKRLQDYIDVRDAASICKLAGTLNENAVLLGVSGNPASNKQIGEIIAAATGAAMTQSGEDNSPSFYFDAGSTHTLLKFQQAYTVEKTIKEMVQ